MGRTFIKFFGAAPEGEAPREGPAGRLEGKTLQSACVAYLAAMEAAAPGDEIGAFVIGEGEQLGPGGG